MTLEPMAQDMEAAKGWWNLLEARRWWRLKRNVWFSYDGPWEPWGETWR